MGQVIAFANQKGGVAKTTTTLNLAVAFQEMGHRVLAVDLDPQGNLTMSQGMDPDTVERSMFDVLVHSMPIEDVIVRAEIDVAVSSIDLAGAELALSSMIGRERALQKALLPVRHTYDFILVDTPPSLGLLTINALTAADSVIVPVQCEYLSLRGLVQLEGTLSMIRENLNPVGRDPRDPADDVRRPHAPRERGRRDAAARTSATSSSRRGSRRRSGTPRRRSRAAPCSSTTRTARPRTPIATWPRRCSMARRRASMREGPLAELFRATEAAQRQAEQREDESPARLPAAEHADPGRRAGARATAE